MGNSTLVVEPVVDETASTEIRSLSAEYVDQAVVELPLLTVRTTAVRPPVGLPSATLNSDW